MVDKNITMSPQPMSTAPKNKRILLYRDNRWDFGFWDKDTHSCYPKPFWNTGGSWREYEQNNDPEYWMPEPTAPPTPIECIKYNDSVWWYKKGTMIVHREDGPAAEYANGTKYWYKNDLFHREDGPAIEHSNGTKCWFKNGKRHRTDGPAVEYVNGVKEYYFEGKLYSYYEWLAITNNTLKVFI